jgi:hypothetical protein
MNDDELKKLVLSTFESVGFYVADPRVLDSCPLSPLTKDYLATVGFPKIPLFNIDFSVVAILPTLDEVIDSLDLPSVPKDADILRTRCIGRQYNIVFAIGCSNGSEVLWLDLKECDVMFVNSTPEQFGACLAAYFQSAESNDNGDPQRRCNELTARLLEIDERAVLHPHSWWSTVLEEVEFGLS